VFYPEAEGIPAYGRADLLVSPTLHAGIAHWLRDSCRHERAALSSTSQPIRLGRCSATRTQALDTELNLHGMG